MRALLDVNVLLPLLDRLHVDHPGAVRWLEANLSQGWASCPFTEAASLRLLTNPRHSSPQTPGRVFDWNGLQGLQQITDIYLLALAVAHGSRLVTFDQRIQIGIVKGCRSEHLVTL